MRVGPADTNSRVALVAEVGNNHEGSTSKAEELIEAAFEAGADAVKLQTFVPELYVSRAQVERLETLAKFALPHDELQRLLEIFRVRGKTVFSTPFDLVSLHRLESASLIKISSGDITFAQLLGAAARTRKDIIISSGASTLAEVHWAVDLIKSTWAEFDHNGNLAVLHCVSAYPAPPESLNLRAISTLKTAFPGVVVGYSDHALGIEASLAAVAVGASIIEKHFTLDKKYSSFRDHQLSADPSEFSRLRERINELELMLGCGEKIPHVVESEMRTTIRRSVSVNRDLPAGHRLEPDDLSIVRPASGLTPVQMDEVVGRTLHSSKKAGDILKESDIS